MELLNVSGGMKIGVPAAFELLCTLLINNKNNDYWCVYLPDVVFEFGRNAEISNLDSVEIVFLFKENVFKF